MATFCLVRHGHTDAVGHRLVGRLPGVPLSSTGHAQAQRLVPMLRTYEIDAIVSSPMERAQQTAQPLAEHLKLEIKTDSALTEMDFGQWQGCSIEELQQDEAWRRFNVLRSLTPAPAGEAMHEVQARMVTALLRLHAENPSATFAVFSHGDPLRSVVCHFCCIPLDCIMRFEIDPGSLTVLELNEWCATFRFINRVPSELSACPV